MRNFILLDRLLDNIGGHNFQYAVDMLQAAEAAGFQPVLGTRREFCAEGRLPEQWQVRPVFRYGWSRANLAGVDGKSKTAIGVDGRRLAPQRSLTSLLTQLVDLPQRKGRLAHLNDFADGCDKILSEFGMGHNNCIFVPTASEFDLVALVRFLKRLPGSPGCDWHLQFHFDIFEGREPNYASQQARRDLIHRQLNAALQQVPQHRFHLYATTPRVARQYNLLDVGEFQPLPYPVSKAFVESPQPTRRVPPKPLRLTCAGVMRREKGKRSLRTVMASLKEEFLSQELQLWIQAQPKTIRRFLGKSWMEQVSFHQSLPERADTPIVAIERPLSREDYIQLIGRTDIGVLLYGSDRYHARCSGILVEMLAAGKPVVVPAGCWLADQIQAPIYEHLSKLCARQGAIWDMQELSASQLRWSRDGKSATAEVPIASGTRAVVATLEFAAQPSPGRYLQVSRHSDVVNRPSLSQSAILGAADEFTQWSALFQQARSDRMKLDLRMAYEPAKLDVQKVVVRCFRDLLPAGQVGAICASPADAAYQIRELLQNYQHYRTTAERSSQAWGYEHDASRTVEILLHNQRRALAAAA